MSEYQYYEFAAVDIPLTRAQMSRLRTLSTRARITPRRFTNTYNWGDFKGDADKLMEEFFDAHLYTSNFGYRKLCLRVPSSALALASVKNYLVDDCLGAREARGKLILQFSLNNENGGWDDDHDWDDSEENYYDNDDYHDDDEDYDENDTYSCESSPRSLDALLDLRAKLARGDLRTLYIGWLSAAQNRLLDDDATEPPIPPGLGNLTSAQQTLAQFLHVDDALIKAAAEKSAPLKPASKTARREQYMREQKAMGAWLAALPSMQKDAWLERLAASGAAANTGKSADCNDADDNAPGNNSPETIAAEARAAFLDFLEIQRKATPPATSAANTPSESDPVPRRTVQALLQRAEEIETIREQLKAEEAARAEAERARKAAEAREKHLDRQALREPALWPAVHSHIATRLPKEYDMAVALLLDLRDLARRRGKNAHAAFVGQLCELKDTWKSRHGLIKRIDAAFAKTDTGKQET